MDISALSLKELVSLRNELNRKIDDLVESSGLADEITGLDEFMPQNVTADIKLCVEVGVNGAGFLDFEIDDDLVLENVVDVLAENKRVKKAQNEFADYEKRLGNKFEKLANKYGVSVDFIEKMFYGSMQ